jgi:hypothetical protein
MSLKQKTLDSFFGQDKTSNTSNKIKLKRYFYIDWSTGYLPTRNAYWTDIKPEEINFIEQINCDYIKKGYYFYICGNLSKMDEKEYVFPKEKVYKNTSFLKSLLQKSIRKMNDKLSIQSCFHLMRMDFNELIRRLPIIMLEDTMLHESFTTLIWIMIVSSIMSKSNFKIKLYMYEWILGLTYVLSSNIDINDIINEEIIEINDCEIKNDEDGQDGQDNEGNYKNNIFKSNIKANVKKVEKSKICEILNSYNKLDEEQLSLLYCIHMRIAYGGLKGDMKMLKTYSDIWYKRFTEKNKLFHVYTDNIKPINISIKELDLSEWDYSAIDYHCEPMILKLLHKKYDDIEIDELRKIIWYNSSSINKRNKNITYNNKVWIKIKPYLERTQKYLLESGYDKKIL